MIDRACLAGWVLAAVLLVAGGALADEVGPQSTSDQLRAARDVGPVEALRFRLHRVHLGPGGRKVTDTEVVLAPSFTLLKTGPQWVLYDHALCRWLAWPAASGGLSNLNCHALPYFFAVEMQARNGPDKVLTAAGQQRSAYTAETALHQPAGGATLTRTGAGAGGDYAIAGKRMVHVAGTAGVLKPEELHRVVRFLTLATPVHPQVRRDIAAAARLPSSVEMDGLGPGQGERETLEIAKFERVSVAYPLPAGLAPVIDSNAWSKDAAMVQAVHAAAAAIRDPAGHPEPPLADLIQRERSAEAAHHHKQALFDFFAAVQLYAADLRTPAGKAALQPAAAALNAALTDPQTAAIWGASGLAGDASAKGDRQAAVRLLLDLDTEGADLVDFRDITIGNLLLAARDREQWDPALRARLPETETTCFWRSIAAAPWPANTYHDVGIALLGDDQIDIAWLAFDLGRAIDPGWKGGVMATIADTERKLEVQLPDFF